MTGSEVSLRTAAEMFRTPGPVSISIFVVGTLPQGSMVRRAGAKPGDRIFVTGSLGELRMRAFFRQCYEPAFAAAVAAGWSGDTFRISVGKDRRLGVSWVTAWDSDDDAVEITIGTGVPPCTLDPTVNKPGIALASITIAGTAGVEHITRCVGS